MTAVYGGEPFLARFAVETGVLTRQDLRTRFRQVHPKVYVWKTAELTTRQKIRAAWLWAGPDSVLCGGAAAYLAGEEYFGTELTRDRIELWRPSWRAPPPGIRARRWTSPPDAIWRGDMQITSPERTAVDLVRSLPSDVRAVAALDALCRTSRVEVGAIADAALAMSGQTGVRRVLGLLPSVEPLAESPKETELRLLMADTGLPAFEPQVEVVDEHGVVISRLDLGNRQWKVGLQYDGGEHLLRERRDHDSMTMMRLGSLGWESRRVTQGMLRIPTTLQGFVRDMFVRQGWRP